MLAMTMFSRESNDRERDMILPELYAFGLLNGNAVCEEFLETNER